MFAVVMYGLASVLWLVAAVAAALAGYPLWAAFNTGMVLFNLVMMGVADRKALSDS